MQGPMTMALPSSPTIAMASWTACLMGCADSTSRTIWPNERTLADVRMVNILWGTKPLRWVPFPEATVGEFGLVSFPTTRHWPP